MSLRASLIRSGTGVSSFVAGCQETPPRLSCRAGPKEEREKPRESELLFFGHRRATLEEEKPLAVPCSVGISRNEEDGGLLGVAVCRVACCDGVHAEPGDFFASKSVEEDNEVLGV